MAAKRRPRRSRKTGARALQSTALARTPTPETEESVRPRGRRFWIKTYLTAFGAVEVALLVLFLGFGGESRRNVAMVQKADGHFEAGHTENAIELMEEAGRRWPEYTNSPAYLRRMARMLSAVGDYQQGGLYFDTFIEQHPDKWDVRAEAGLAAWEAENRERAVRLFSAELSEANPQNDQAQLYLGLARLDRGDLQGALQRFQGVVNQDLLRGKPAQAIAEAKRMLVEPARNAAFELATITSPNSAN